jgi:DNA-directed RNA polymerase specialized sigma subunit
MFSQTDIDNLDGTRQVDPAHQKALQRMSRLEKLILVLTYHEGLSLLETGIILGISEAEVRRTLASIEERFARLTALNAV